MRVAERDDNNTFINRMSWIAFFLAFLVALLGIIMNWQAPAADIAAVTGSLSMNKTAIPQSVVDRVIARRGREHIHDDLDPARTALVVVDMQNAFMLPGVAHSLCLQAHGIVPNINRLAQAVREPVARWCGSRAPIPTRRR